VYAGLRPKRVSHFISLDGFGPLVVGPPTNAKAALAASLALIESDRQHRRFDSVEEVAARLLQANRRLSQAQALFLAQHSTGLGTDGRRTWLFDPVYQRTIPSLRSIEEWLSIWSDVEAPVLWIASGDPAPHAPKDHAAIIQARRAAMRVAKFVRLPDTGHNLHHDAAFEVAVAIDDFLATTAG
jgi:pimeloyl-ACP methyl ester carboxylesterase